MNAGATNFNYNWQTIFEPQNLAEMAAREEILGKVEASRKMPIGDLWKGLTQGLKFWEKESTPPPPTTFAGTSKAYLDDLKNVALKSVEKVGDLDLNTLNLPEFAHAIGEGPDAINLKFGKDQLSEIYNLLNKPASDITQELLEATFSPDKIQNNPALLTFAEKIGLKVVGEEVLTSANDLNMLKLQGIAGKISALKGKPAAEFVESLFRRASRETIKLLNMVSYAQAVADGNASHNYFKNATQLASEMPGAKWFIENVRKTGLGNWLVEKLSSSNIEPWEEVSSIGAILKTGTSIGLNKETFKLFGEITSRSIRSNFWGNLALSIFTSYGDMKKGYDQGGLMGAAKMLYAPARALLIGGLATAAVTMALPFIVPALPIALAGWGAFALTAISTIGAGLIADKFVVGGVEHLASGIVNGFGAGGHNAGQASPFNNPTVASGLPSSSGLSSGTLSPAGQDFYNSLAV
jgi:hypothetical protein